ncbi:MAG: hypothetical protein OXH49_18180 [Gemmatimonadetes bacterium]|nr:hypothetical protein [Gemmatimonadota bacterium]
MQREIPSYDTVVDTLHWAAQGYVTGHREAIRPMPWRRILDHLSLLGRDELLCIDPSANGTENGIAVRRIAVNGRSGEEPSSTKGSGKTTWTVDMRKGLRAKTRFAQRIEMAVRSGQYRSVTCMRRGSRIFAVMTAAPAPAARSNGDCLPPSRVSAGTARKDVHRMTSYQRRTRRNRHAAYMIAAASLLLSVAALVSAATGRNENPPPPMPANAIVGHVLVDGRGADGVTVALDGRAVTATTGGGAFRFRDVETGTHTIAISNYPADARFDRTSATVSIDTEGRAATVNFSGSYIHRPRIARPVVVAEGTGKHSTLFALRDAAGRAAIEM